MSATTYYTNNTPRVGQTTQEYTLGLASNYAVSNRSTTSKVILDNKTTGMAYPCKDVVEIWYENIPVVKTDVLEIQYPAPTSNGIRWGVNYHTVVKTPVGDDSFFEEPIVFTISARHRFSESISNEMLAEVFERLVSVLRRESDNSYRFDDFVRKAIKPEAD